MTKHSMIFIGLDTHKEFHEVAYCEEQREASPVHKSTNIQAGTKRTRLLIAWLSHQK